MAARFTRLLVVLGLLLGAALPSAAAAVVRLRTSQQSAASVVPARGAAPAYARSYFGARYLRADLGRFTTIDPVYTWTENLVDPQRWNRYTYVRNSPLKFTDPDGRMIGPILLVAGLVAAAQTVLNAPSPAAVREDRLTDDPTVSNFTEALAAEAALGPLAKWGIPVLGRALPWTKAANNVAVRKYYLSQLEEIPGRIDRALPLREQAIQAFQLRNGAKMEARALMKDRAAADLLSKTDPIPTLPDVVRKAYQEKGLVGDDLWRYILDSASRSRASVNKALGVGK